MIKSHEVEVTKTEIKIDEVICNCCGLPIKHNLYRDVKDDVIDDRLHVEQNWCYHSHHDCEIHKFDICESCYDKWVSTFKIPIEIKEY